LKVFKKPDKEDEEEEKEAEGVFKISGAREIIVTKGNGLEKLKPSDQVVE